VEKTMKLLGTPITKIGVITEEPTLILKMKNKNIEARGWEHFKS